MSDHSVLLRLEEIRTLLKSIDQRLESIDKQLVKTDSGLVDCFEIDEVVNSLLGTTCCISTGAGEFCGPLVLDDGALTLEGFKVDLNRIGYVDPAYVTINDGRPINDPICKIHYYKTAEEAQMIRDARGGMLVDPEDG
jgi:hypothetical protein